MRVKSIREAFLSDDYRQSFFWLLFLFAIVMLAGVGFRSPWPADEPRFAEAAREMVTSGHWFFPLRGGELYPDKPPVFMWSIALFYALFGNMKIAFMLPNILISLVTFWCVFDLAARFWNVRVARYAAIALLIAPQFMLQAKSAQIDAMVTAWITIAMYGFMRHFFIKPSWSWYFVAWGMMGLGIITKGVGFLPIFVFIPVLGLHFSRRYSFGKAIDWKLWLGPLAMLVVIGCWLVPMVYIANHSGNADLMAYKNNILFRQTMKRYADSWTHLQPWYYFILRFPLLWFPLPWLLLSKSFWKSLDPRIVTLLIWVVCVIGFFSCSPGKREVYILPALPMLAVAVAYSLATNPMTQWLRWLVNGLMGFVSVLMVILGVLALLHIPAIVKLAAKQSLEPEQLNDFVTSFGWMALIGGGVALGALISFRRYSTLLRLSVISVWGWLLFGLVGYPVLDPIRTAANPIMEKAAEAIGPTGELALVDFKEQFLLASPVDLTQFSYLASRDDQERNAWLWMKAKTNRFVLIPDGPATCFDLSQATLLGHGYRRTWLLVGEQAMQSQCAQPEQIVQYHMKAH